jgi:hypothetical protein
MKLIRDYEDCRHVVDCFVLCCFVLCVQFFDGGRESMPWMDQRMQNYMMQQQAEETSKFLESRRPEAHHHQFVQPREDMMRFVQQRRSSQHHGGGVDDGGYQARPEVRQSAAGGDKWGSVMHHTPASAAHSKSLPKAHQTAAAQPLPRSDHGHGRGHQYWLDADRGQQEEDYRRSMEVAKRVAMNNNNNSIHHNGRYAPAAGGQQLGFEQRPAPKQVAVPSQHHQHDHQQQHQQHQHQQQHHHQHMRMRSSLTRRHYEDSCSEEDDDDDYYEEEEGHAVRCMDGRKIEVAWADKTCNNNNTNNHHRNMDESSGHGHHGYHHSQQHVSAKPGPTSDESAATNESRFEFQHYEAPKSHSQAASFKQVGGQREEVDRSSGAAQGVTKTKQKQQKQPQQQQQQQQQKQQQNGGRKAGDGNSQNSKSNIPAPPQQQGKGHQKKNANAVQASEEINHASLKATKVNSKQEKSVHGQEQQQQQQQESTKGVDLLRKVSQDIKQKVLRLLLP